MTVKATHQLVSTLRKKYNRATRHNVETGFIQIEIKGNWHNIKKVG